ncbi:MAG: hypothetical protein FWH10_06585 [Oscillospiraceae bacterium]|nr:hypothetical protein [Oscillospiraceae bacterium]
MRGVGWLPFEPTVSYAEEEEAEAAPYIYTPPARLPDGGSMFMPVTEPEEYDDDDFAGTGRRAEEETRLPVSFYIISAVILACAAIYAANYIIISKRFKDFRTSGTNAAVLKMLEYILKFLRYCGFVMHNEEGLKEFSKRISPNFETINLRGWEEIAEIMQKARYSRHEISELERESIYEFIETLRKECLKRLKFGLKFKMRFVYFAL